MKFIFHGRGEIMFHGRGESISHAIKYWIGGAELGFGMEIHTATFGPTKDKSLEVVGWPVISLMSGLVPRIVPMCSDKHAKGARNTRNPRVYAGVVISRFE